MPIPITSKKRAHLLSTVFFLLGLGVLLFTEDWWPGIMLVVGLPLAIRQYLLGRRYDTMITLLVFVGTFITVEFDISWRIFLPILFTLGAMYILFREWMESKGETVEEKDEDAQQEIEEENESEK